ncbi:unnamed protein product [Bubo scandiacus]
MAAVPVAVGPAAAAEGPEGGSRQLTAAVRPPGRLRRGLSCLQAFTDYGRLFLSISSFDIEACSCEIR